MHEPEPYWLNAYDFMKGILRCRKCPKKVKYVDGKYYHE